MIDITPTDHPSYAQQRGGGGTSAGSANANTSNDHHHHHHPYERPSSPQHNAFAPSINDHDANVLFHGGSYMGMTDISFRSVFSLLIFGLIAS